MIRIAFPLALISLLLSNTQMVRAQPSFCVGTCKNDHVVFHNGPIELAEVRLNCKCAQIHSSSLLSYSCSVTHTQNLTTANSFQACVTCGSTYFPYCSSAANQNVVIPELQLASSSQIFFVDRCATLTLSLIHI